MTRVPSKKIDFKTTECIIILRQIEYLAKPKQYIILDVGATNIIVAEDRSMLCIGCSGCTHQQCRRKVTKFEHARHTTEEIIGTSGSFPFSPSHSSRSQLALSKKSDYITHQWYSFFFESTSMILILERKQYKNDVDLRCCHLLGIVRLVKKWTGGIPRARVEGGAACRRCIATRSGRTTRL